MIGPNPKLFPKKLWSELGEGEPVRVVAVGPMGGDPLLVQIGFTRFALRRAEAARISVRSEVAA